MTLWRYLTGVFMPLGLALIFSYDYMADRLGGNIATISRTCLDIATRYPSFKCCICYLLGLLAAHLFAPRPGTGAVVHWIPIIAAAGIPLIVAGVNLVTFLWPEPMRVSLDGPTFVQWIRELAPVILWLVVGAVAGSIAVAQHWQA